MKRILHFTIVSIIAFICGCSPVDEQLVPINSTENLAIGSDQILHDIAISEITLLQSMATNQVKVKKNLSGQSLKEKVVSGEISLNDNGSSLSFYSEISSSPEIYNKYVNDVFDKSRQLVQLNSELLGRDKIAFQKALLSALDRQYKLVRTERSRVSGASRLIVPSYNNDLYLQGPKEQAAGNCSSDLNVDLAGCFKAFALKCALAAALSETVVGAAAVLLEAIVENAICHDTSIQRFDTCLNRL